jgi:hypothetical protein
MAFTHPTRRAEQATAEAKVQQAADTTTMKPRGPRRVSICANEQVFGVVMLPRNVNHPSSSIDKENQRPCPPKPSTTVINPYATAKKPPRSKDDERSPVDAYFDTLLEYNLDPAASTMSPPTTAATTTTTAATSTTLKRVLPPPPHAPAPPMAPATTTTTAAPPMAATMTTAPPPPSTA